MSFENNNIIIHQALHGYADGHRLLESSYKFSNIEARTAQILSDMSGPRMIDGFETYLTGYSLPQSKIYAFARTWYAPEMSRPGCVWTHTLLIEASYLAMIQDFAILLDLFIRPVKGEPFNSYKEALRIPIKSSYESFIEPSTHQRNIARSTLFALYNTPKKIVFLIADNTKEYESLTIEIWSQQWPNLRRSFRFCTGSLSNRTVNGESFDFQIAPRKQLLHLRRESPNAEFVNEKTNSFSEDAKWVNYAISDLTGEKDSSIRRFLWEYGSESDKGRLFYTKLIDLYIYIEDVKFGEKTLHDLIEFVGRSFPKPNELNKLKCSIFRNNLQSQNSFFPIVKESEVLNELVTTNYYSAFDAKELHVRERAKELLNNEPFRTKNLILKLDEKDITPLAEEFLLGISQSIEPKDVIEISRSHPDLLFFFLKHNPNLAISPLIWRIPYDDQYKVFNLLFNISDQSNDFKASIVTAMLEAESDIEAEKVISQVGEYAITLFLQWFDSSIRNKTPEIKKGWKNALESHPITILNWLKNNPDADIKTNLLIADSLSPNSLAVIEFGADVWLPLAKTVSTSLRGAELIEISAFLLALGFNNPGLNAAELVANSFEAVHNAAYEKRLGNKSWALLKDHAPSLSIWRDWDKCERLRAALVESFIKYQWPTKYFLVAVQDRRTFQRILDYCRDSKKGREFIKKIAKLVNQSAIKATWEQKKELSYYL